jgi:hypothetical protein
MQKDEVRGGRRASTDGWASRPSTLVVGVISQLGGIAIEYRSHGESAARLGGIAIEYRSYRERAVRDLGESR